MAESMKVYSTQLTAEQNTALARYESLTGIEPFGVEEFEAGEWPAHRLWQENVSWLESVLADVVNIHFPVPLEEFIAENDQHGQGAAAY